MDHAERELRLAGYFDKTSDYGGALGKAVLDLVKKFSEQGHSGASAGAVRALFARVADFKSLSPLTDDPAEWNEVGEQDDKTLYQSQRDPEAFSVDEGKHYYLLSEVQCHAQCTKCGFGWTGSPRRKLSKDDLRCAGCKKNTMKLVQPGVKRDSKKALHASVSAHAKKAGL